MPLPNTKQEFADWILRRLGAPVINIEVADVQLEDCIDEAVRYYQEYHYDGAQRSYRTIQITEEMLDGNARKPRGLSAPMYDVDLENTYRVGNRVTTYDENGQPDAVWIKFDSEERVIQRTYTEDTDGPYFVFAGQEVDLVMTITDSDGPFITYDSDDHNVFNYSRFFEFQDEFFVETRIRRFQGDSEIFFLDGVVWTSAQPAIYVRDGNQYRVYDPSIDSENGYDSEFYFRAPWIDVDGVLVEYDSDTHIIYDYNVDVNGLWVDSEYTHTTSPTADSETNKVLYDSDRHVNVTYVNDPVGDYIPVTGPNGVVYIVYDSESAYHRQQTRYRKESVQPIRYLRHNKKPVSQFMVPGYDSDTNKIQFSLYSDSEVDFVVSGIRWFDGQLIIGNIHTLNVNQELFFFRDSDQTYYNYQEVPRTQFDSGVYYLRHLPDLFLDSDGVLVNYDSDKHVIYDYDVLTFDSDPTTLGITLYVDSESLEVFRTDSDVDKVIYDSDTHTIVYWDSETWPEDSDSMPETGWAWVDSDGTKVLYDSDKHNFIRFDSDRYGSWIYDSLSGNFVIYDSDADSDNLYLWDKPDRRFTRRSYRTSPRFVKRTEYPIFYTRHEKIPEDVLIKREKVLLGTRYSRTETEATRRELSFTEMWKKESAVVVEPKLNLDYSREGQIGVQVPEDVIAVTKVFRLGQQSSLSMYNYEYQLFLNNFDFFYGHGGGGGLSNYYTTKMNLEHIDFLLNTQPAIRFNKHKDRLYIDMDWNRAHKGDHLVCEVYEITDPDIWGKVYQDIWLKKYATALVKQQWGANLRKYENVELPGGIVLSGQALYDEAAGEIEKLEEEIRQTTLEMDSILIG